MSTLLGILTQKAFISSCTYRRTTFAPIFWGRSIATAPAGLTGRGGSSVRSVFHGQFNTWPGRNQVSVIILQFAFVPLIMALISSSLLAAPFTFHNAIFGRFQYRIGVLLQQFGDLVLIPLFCRWEATSFRAPFPAAKRPNRALFYLCLIRKFGTAA